MLSINPNLNSLPHTPLEWATAADAYTELVRQSPHVHEVTLIKYHAPKRLELRANLSIGDLELIAAARELRSQSGFPFWDCVFNLTGQLTEVPEALFAGALFHQSLKCGRRSLTRYQVLDGALRTAAEEVPAETCLAISSRVSLANGQVAHIPMLDFQCTVNSQNNRFVIEIAGKLFPAGGVVLNSGNSYHAFGNMLVTSRELPRFLGRALLFGTFVDGRYIAHQLMQDECCLRISGSASSPSAPAVIATF